MKILGMKPLKYAEVAAASIHSHLRGLPDDKERHEFLIKEIGKIISDVQEAARKGYEPILVIVRDMR